MTLKRKIARFLLKHLYHVVILPVVEYEQINRIYIGRKLDKTETLRAKAHHFTIRKKRKIIERFFIILN
jgi:hypothetical protein